MIEENKVDLRKQGNINFYQSGYKLCVPVFTFKLNIKNKYYYHHQENQTLIYIINSIKELIYL